MAYQNYRNGKEDKIRFRVAPLEPPEDIPEAPRCTYEEAQKMGPEGYAGTKYITDGSENAQINLYGETVSVQPTDARAANTNKSVKRIRRLHPWKLYTGRYLTRLPPGGH